uniref:Uncharacterized protein n=1 Tax=Peronospora matthiolae TaxID=2874970 RepID=A0AAV1VAM6_9STRA
MVTALDAVLVLGMAFELGERVSDLGWIVEGGN